MFITIKKAKRDKEISITHKLYNLLKVVVKKRKIVKTFKNERGVKFCIYEQEDVVGIFMFVLVCCMLSGSETLTGLCLVGFFIFGMINLFSKDNNDSVSKDWR